MARPRRLIALGPPYDDGTYWDGDILKSIIPEEETGDLAVRLARAMLDSKNGVSGAASTGEQMALTTDQADWLIHRLGFHGLRLTIEDDGLSTDERQAAYSRWLHSRSYTRIGEAHRG